MSERDKVVASLRKAGGVEEQQALPVLSCQHRFFVDFKPAALSTFFGLDKKLTSTPARRPAPMKKAA